MLSISIAIAFHVQDGYDSLGFQRAQYLLLQFLETIGNALGIPKGMEVNTFPLEWKFIRCPKSIER